MFGACRGTRSIHATVKVTLGPAELATAAQADLHTLGQEVPLMRVLAELVMMGLAAKRTTLRVVRLTAGQVAHDTVALVAWLMTVLGVLVIAVQAAQLTPALEVLATLARVGLAHGAQNSVNERAT